MCGITANHLHKEIHKTALGATESVDWEYVEDTLELVEKLQAEKVKMSLSIEQAENSTMLQDFVIEAKSKSMQLYLEMK